MVDQSRNARGVSDMAFIVFLVLVLLTGAALGAPGILRRRPRRMPVQEQTSVAPDPIDVRTDVDVERDEMGLVERLLDGDLSPGLYRQRMADLALQDAQRHPVVVPRNHKR